MALNTAIRHLKAGHWQKAHAVVQNDPSEMGCWAHGIVHMLEGDLRQAQIFAKRAQRGLTANSPLWIRMDDIINAKPQSNG